MSLVPDRTDIDTTLSDRDEFLRKLIEQPRPKSKLEEGVECSRSTLDRALRELAEANLAKYKNGLWQPTLLGRRTLQNRDEYLDSLENLSEAAAVVNELPPDSPITGEFLIDANVHEASSTMPDAVTKTLLNSMAEANKIRIATPAMFTVLAEQFYEWLDGDQLECLEMLLSPGLFEETQVVLPGFTDTDVVGSQLELYSGPIPFDFGLWIADTGEAGVIVYTDQGIQGHLVNDRNAAVEWAHDQYAHAKQEVLQTGSAKS
ncbi:helix-turn-helix transcriptional regulator [Haloarcula argentinensis]|uniref:Transcriptional regulator n=1 Tax=Haloarcula argentinensis TaxID=43776 RepID=A0A847U8S3_HALAR|nr:transcriptional regulator [Haloarcula argentinensis]NLV12173.1 transcriptional regulator [Haloarcula argentinensis]